MNHEGLKRQGSLYVLAVLCVAVAAAVIVPRLWPQTTQACTEYTRAFGENFNDVTYKDLALSSVAHWPSGPITLPALGSNFVVGSADSMGRRIYQCAAGDFTGDSYPDLIGLDITGEFPVIAAPTPGPSFGSSGTSIRPTWAPLPSSRSTWRPLSRNSTLTRVPPP